MATQLLEYFEIVDIMHVSRNENQEANDLAQIASGYKISKSRLQEIIEVQENMVSDVPPPPGMNIQEARGKDNPDDSVSCYEGFNDKCLENFTRHEVFAIGNSSPSDWRKTILKYLENPFGNTERKIKYKALSYVRVANELLKKTPKGIFLKCLGNTEAYLATSEVYSGSWGAHQTCH